MSAILGPQHSESAARPWSDLEVRRAKLPLTDRQRRIQRRVIQALLIVLLLAAHLAVRGIHTCQQTDTSGSRHDYTRTYAHSLSLLFGRGFDDLPVHGTPAATPVDEFLWGKRNSLTREELDAYLADMPESSQDPSYGTYGPLASTRILDVHLTALLWRMFGVSWIVSYMAAAVASTITCLAIFLIGRRIGGGFWPGFLAAAIFFASPTEKFLTGWSIRDTSPLWFAAGAFCLLVCCFGQTNSLRKDAACGFLLGLAAMLGTGWRMDSLIIAPFVGVSMVILLLLRTRSIAHIAAASLCFVAGSVATHLAIDSLGPAERQPAGSGFHMAYYGDAVRSRLLCIENSSQVAWCDMQTAMEANRYTTAVDGIQEPLPYISKRYGDVCRRMYFHLARYNAYRWTVAFPVIWWEALRGYPGDAANFEGASNYQQTLLDRGRPVAWLTLDTGPLEALFPPAIPLLVIAGALFGILCGPQRLLALVLLLFSVYFAAITFAVLPMQKHMAMMLLPMSLFAGIGIWSLGQSLRPAFWQSLYRRFTRRETTWFAGSAVAIVAIWGAACLVTREISASERRGTISDLLALAEQGEDAPETIRGPGFFRTTILPGSDRDNIGYLLTIRTGADPGLLQCNHRRVGPPTLRPTALSTTHRLLPDCVQHFFVSCLQGTAFGDPRAYTCTVRISGHAELLSSRRVNLADWNRLAVSTLIAPQDNSPGSPYVGDLPTWRRTVNLPVFAQTDEGGASVSALHEGVLFRPRPPDPHARPLTHLAFFDADSGVWSALVSDGASFNTALAAVWNNTLNWRDRLAGDFDGDGVTDYAGRNFESGAWWVASSEQEPRPSHSFGAWSPKQDWTHIGAGDFNGDGTDDLVGYAQATGQWRVGISDGSRLINSEWADWPADRPLQQVHTADFNGDGRTDVVAFDARAARWVLFFSNESRFTLAECSGPDGASPDLVRTGDFNGDGKADVAFVSEKSRTGYVGISNGMTFDFESFELRGADEISHLETGDFDDDEADELLVASATRGTVLRCRQTEEGWLTTEAGAVGQPIRFLATGQFDGRGGNDVAAVTDDGGCHVGTLDGDQLQFRQWLAPGGQTVKMPPLVVQSLVSGSVQRR